VKIAQIWPFLAVFGRFFVYPWPDLAVSTVLCAAGATSLVLDTEAATRPVYHTGGCFSCIHGPILLSPQRFALLVQRVSSWTRKRPPGRYIGREVSLRGHDTKHGCFSCIHGPILLSPHRFVLLVPRVVSWTRKRPPGRGIRLEICSFGRWLCCRCRSRALWTFGRSPSSRPTVHCTEGCLDCLTVVATLAHELSWTSVLQHGPPPLCGRLFATVSINIRGF
jgi:hypothetical protein